jgi:muramoyltetrapeptide carboxypeptidase
MLMNLKRAGQFEGCKGILVGGMSDMNDNSTPYGKTAEDIILENCRDLSIPIVFGLPAGHIDNNCALILGRTLRLKRNKNQIKMEFNGTA